MHRTGWKNDETDLLQRCPRWVKNGPRDPKMGLPLHPEQRTSSGQPSWSGSCQKETHAPQQVQTATLFDHLRSRLLPEGIAALARARSHSPPPKRNRIANTETVFGRSFVWRKKERRLK
jgi:hypothetical protein